MKNDAVNEIVTESGKKAGEKFVDIIIDTFLKPKFESIVNRPKNYMVLVDLLANYIKKSYENGKYMNTIVFRSESKTVDELYIPLTLMKTGRKNEKIVINAELNNIFEKPRKILILDTAGMGKSTLVKYLYLFCIENGLGTPIIIELRRLEMGQSVEEYITESIKLVEKGFSSGDIIELIKRGDFIFFLDGYDEISDEKKKVVTENLSKFVLASGENSFVLTSRDDDSLAEFTQFEKYHIKPLTDKEAYALIRKYDKDNPRNIAECLIQDIEKNDNYRILREFLRNPLMVSLLYLTYQFKGVIPYKKHIFYRQVYDALFEKHDCVKGIGAIHKKKSGLDIEDFRKVLAAMGFFSIQKGAVEFERKEIEALIEKSVSLFPNLSGTNSKLFLDDVLHAVPLFLEEGLNYKWAHKSFAEYFAADFICNEIKDKEEKVINDMLNSENSAKYYNILEFLFDMDYSGAIKYLVYPAVKDYVNTYPKLFNQEKFDDLPKETKDILIFFIWLDDIYFVKIDKMRSSLKNRDEELDDYLDAFKLFQKNGHDMFSSARIKSYTDKIFQFSNFKKYHQVMKLVQRKNIDIFVEKKVQEYSMKVYKMLDVGVYELNDNTDNILTDSNNAKAIASAIFHSNYEFQNKIVDYEKCCIYLRKLEKEISKTSMDIFSLE
ncbi:NACHT domain-containing protein [Blautia sp. HCP3S3_C4]|uniref:NACHT domain-containing protein n=1 Tax=Blautia sp. HCP3S3_C4 TaxID=3438911 RepID=UPI003F890657